MALGTPSSCSTLVYPMPKMVVPKLENLDVLDQCSRPSLDHFSNMQRKTKKNSYMELLKGAIIMVSDEDKGHMNIMVELGVEFNKNKRVKEEVFSVAKLNAKLEWKMKEDMAAAATENAKRMFVIQEELRASNAKTNMILEMLSRTHSFATIPQPAYPFRARYPLHGPFPGGPSYHPTPHPTPMNCQQTPPPAMMRSWRPSERMRVYECLFMNL